VLDVEPLERRYAHVLHHPVQRAGAAECETVREA
jgi:hypothetical protein